MMGQCARMEGCKHPCSVEGSGSSGVGCHPSSSNPLLPYMHLRTHQGKTPKEIKTVREPLMVLLKTPKRESSLGHPLLYTYVTNIFFTIGLYS